ncbi:MAG: transcriptional repressor [Cytophagaceae bacterium]|nr:transcriptional repressor [Gemmatimonadaceae bacterium]
MERRTRQRSAIQEALSSAERPLTPAEVLEMAQAKVPNLGLATVYRALRSMIEEGSAHLVDIPGTPPRYESSHLGHHHHFHCRTCLQVFEVDGCPGNLARLAPPGFVLDGHEVVLYGRCTRCAAA